MKPPVKPHEEDCCSSGCTPCIFDVYNEQMKLYQKFLAGNLLHDISKNAISKLQYTNFTVIQTIEISEIHIMLVFKQCQDISDPKESSAVWWKPGQHFLFKYNNSKMSCTRAYTPLKLDYIAERNEYDFVVIVKKYDFGTVSPYLYSIKVGEQTRWRGPYGSYEYRANEFNRLIMITHGTGISPFYTIVQSILNNEDDFTKIILLYCCKNVDEILLRNELYTFKAFWNFSYKVFLAKPSGSNKILYQEPIQSHKLSQKDVISLSPFDKDQFLLCGFTEFTNHYHSLLSSQNVLESNIVIF